MKFKIGDRCRVIKNRLAPHCIGYTVTIINHTIVSGKDFYYIDQDGIKGIADENCLELIKE